MVLPREIRADMISIEHREKIDADSSRYIVKYRDIDMHIFLKSVYTRICSYIHPDLKEIEQVLYARYNDKNGDEICIVDNAITQYVMEMHNISKERAYKSINCHVSPYNIDPDENKIKCQTIGYGSHMQTKYRLDITYSYMDITIIPTFVTRGNKGRQINIEYILYSFIPCIPSMIFKGVCIPYRDIHIIF